MFSRVGGATLALIAAASLALSIAGGVELVPDWTFPGWWSGHPSVRRADQSAEQSRVIKAKAVDVGLLATRGCNTGGDKHCEALEVQGLFEKARYGAAGMTGLLAIVALLLALCAAKQSEARKTLAKIAVFAAVVAGVVAIALIVLGPDIKSESNGTVLVIVVPLGIGTYLFAGGMMATIGASVLALQPTPEPLAEPPKPRSRRPSAPAPLPGTPPPVDVVALQQEYSHAPYPPAGSSPMDAYGGAQPLFSSAPQLRPLYDATPDQGGTGGFVPMPQPVQGFQLAPPPPPISDMAPSFPMAAPFQPAPPPIPPPPPPAPPPPRKHPSSKPPPLPGAAARSANASAVAPAPSGPVERPSPPELMRPSGDLGAPRVSEPRLPAELRMIETAPGLPPPVAPTPSVIPPIPAIPPPGSAIAKRPTLTAAIPPIPVVPFPAPGSKPAQHVDTDPSGVPFEVSTTDAQAFGDGPATESGSQRAPTDDDADNDSVIPPPAPQREPVDVEAATVPAGSSMIRGLPPIPEPEPAPKPKEDRLARGLRAFGIKPTARDETGMFQLGRKDRAAKAAAAKDAAAARSAAAAAHRTEPVPTLAAPAPAEPEAKVPISTASNSLPPPTERQAATSGPSPACPQCEAPMAWVEAHLRFYCRACKMYF